MMLATPSQGHVGHYYPDGPEPLAVTIRCHEGGFPERPGCGSEQAANGHGEWMSSPTVRVPKLC
jgi:hypothetical protein